MRTERCSAESLTVAQIVERDRLSRRARRLELVLGALRDRVEAMQSARRAPVALISSIRGFEDELARMRRRLSEIEAIAADPSSGDPEQRESTDSAQCASPMSRRALDAKVQ